MLIIVKKKKKSDFIITLLGNTFMDNWDDFCVEVSQFVILYFFKTEIWDVA